MTETTTPKRAARFTSDTQGARKDVTQMAAPGDIERHGTAATEPEGTPAGTECAPPAAGGHDPKPEPRAGLQEGGMEKAIGEILDQFLPLPPVSSEPTTTEKSAAAVTPFPPTLPARFGDYELLEEIA